MQHGKWFIAVLFSAMVAMTGMSVGASAQDAAGEMQQMALTETQIKNLIAAQPDLAKVAKRLEGLPDDAEVSVQKELDAIATKHGFTDFNELDQVSANVQIVLDGIDPESGAYTDPIEGMKEELADVKADSEMPENEKKELVSELEEAIASMPPLKHPENIDLVKKHHKAIQQALDAGEEGK